MTRAQHATGFTLIELVVVLVIVAVLAAIVTPAYMSMTKNHNQAVCMDNLRTLGVDLAQYRQDYDAYPAAPLPAYLTTQNPSLRPLSRQGYAPTTQIAFFGNKNDVTISGQFQDTTPRKYILKIAGTGSPDQLQWSDNGGSTWVSDTVAPSVPLSYGMFANFGAVTGHATGDTWSFLPQMATPPAGLPSPIPLDTSVTAGATAVTYTIATTPLPPVPTAGMFCVLADDLTNPSNAEIGTVQSAYNSANSYTVLLIAPLHNSYPITASTKPVIDFRTGNFGLATLNQLNNLGRANAHVTQAAIYHCPQIPVPDNTTPATSAANPPKFGIYSTTVGYQTFDSLWSGYNTYDVTYNYDQYANDIATFDAAMGYAGCSNAGRQLGNAYPPGDTVVCWCYGHRPEADALYTVPSTDINDPASHYIPSVPNELNLNNTDLNAPELHAAESSRAYDVILVLWVDGSVGVMRPYLMKSYLTQSHTDNQGHLNHYPVYCWVPPFLYAPGGWR